MWTTRLRVARTWGFTPKMKYHGFSPVDIYFIIFLYFLNFNENNNYMKKSIEISNEEVKSSSSKESLYRIKENDWQKQTKL